MTFGSYVIARQLLRWGVYRIAHLHPVGAIEQLCVRVVLQGDRPARRCYVAEWAACAAGVVIAHQLDEFVLLINKRWHV